VLVDIAVPRNIDPAAAGADNVFAYSIDAQTAVVEHSLGRRAREAVRAESIIEEEARKFATWLRGLEAAPVVRQLREHFERVRADEVKRSAKHFPESEQEHVEQLTRALVNKLLHAPTVRLKSVDPGSESGLAWIDAVRELFALGGSRRGADRGL
jgi:glutamyl-tRNA reductase